jgi:hypothetical protein
LWENGFSIEKEVYLADMGHFYTVMSVVYTGENTRYTLLDSEIGFGEHRKNLTPESADALAGEINLKLYDLNNAADVAELGSTTIAGKTVDQIKAAGFSYVNKNNADKGANLSSAISGDGISKKTFFTARNFRNNTSNYDIPGYLYFKVTSDKITDQDTDLYVVIEYLDYDPNMGLNQNSNGTANYKNQSAFSHWLNC